MMALSSRSGWLLAAWALAVACSSSISDDVFLRSGASKLPLKTKRCSLGEGTTPDKPCKIELYRGENLELYCAGGEFEPKDFADPNGKYCTEPVGDKPCNKRKSWSKTMERVVLVKPGLVPEIWNLPHTYKAVDFNAPEPVYGRCKHPDKNLSLYFAVEIFPRFAVNAPRLTVCSLFDLYGPDTPCSATMYYGDIHTLLGHALSLGTYDPPDLIADKDPHYCDMPYNGPETCPQDHLEVWPSKVAIYVHDTGVNISTVGPFDGTGPTVANAFFTPSKGDPKYIQLTMLHKMEEIPPPDTVVSVCDPRNHDQAGESCMIDLKPSKTAVFNCTHLTTMHPKTITDTDGSFCTRPVWGFHTDDCAGSTELWQKTNKPKVILRNNLIYITHTNDSLSEKRTAYGRCMDFKTKKALYFGVNFLPKDKTPPRPPSPPDDGDNQRSSTTYRGYLLGIWLGLITATLTFY